MTKGSLTIKCYLAETAMGVNIHAQETTTQYTSAVRESVFKNYTAYTAIINEIVNSFYLVLLKYYLIVLKINDEF